MVEINEMIQGIQTLGAIDIHFHGAFGIDLMSASPSDLDELSRLLWKNGVAGFCPTTLSVHWDKLLETVRKLGHWIARGKFPGAIPVGIHLEGPYLSPDACGAHPPDAIRTFSFTELNQLWEESQQTLKIITLAPEHLSTQQIKKLAKWCQDREIHLSLGHSQAHELQAQIAFKLGFRGVTHAWNALSFHHRSPGVLGAALGNPNVFLELMIDQVHVSPTVVRWTLCLHPSQQICFISDCLSAGATGGKGHLKKKVEQFGPLSIQLKDGACRLSDGRLAGGGQILTQAYLKWLLFEAKKQEIPIETLLKRTLGHITEVPLRLLQAPRRIFSNRKVFWQITASGQIHVIPIDSAQTYR
jgi:N-acetylglucosamine-6-phosphate deacetylase